MRHIWAVFAAVMLGTVADASGPLSSIRPAERPLVSQVPAGQEALDFAAYIAPQPIRPQARPAAVVAIPVISIPVISTTAIVASPRPQLRTASVLQKAMAKRRLQAKGAVCGDPDIQGAIVGAVPGRLKGCGVAEAVKVKSVAGVRLSQQSVMDCATAKALKSWINRGMKRAVGNTGGGVAEIRVMAHYACRTRNSKKGAKISEHGKGRAIDIGGFTLRDGSKISVLNGWNGRGSKALKRMHKAACGPFGTVLGPNANAAHRDHFHFDTARYRSGSYCR